MNSKNDLLRVAPVKNYTPPKLPTLEESSVNHPLKALPSRWKKNAAVIACLGFTGALTLSGCTDALRDRYHHGGAPFAPYYVACPTENEALNNIYHHGGSGYAPYYVAYPTEQETLAHMMAQIEAAELNLRTHWGGSGSGPYYVAYLTEQEVLGFIRAKLEAAGLNFDAAPPEYTIFGIDDTNPRPAGVDEIGIALFDAGNNVAIASLSNDESHRAFSPQGCALTYLIAEEFTRRLSDITFGVFYNPGAIVGFGPSPWDEDEEYIQEVTPEKKEEARHILIERITAQVDEFIAWLQAEGIV